MTWQEITNHWELLRTRVKEKWDLITDDDLTAVEGDRKHLLDLLQVRYGYDKAAANRELDELVASIDLPAPTEDVSDVNNITVATNP